MGCHYIDTLFGTNVVNWYNTIPKRIEDLGLHKYLDDNMHQLKLLF